MSTLRHEMVIIWPEEADCFLVHLPDFPEQTYRTYGNSYEEAARNGQEVLAFGRGRRVAPART
ncbi:type II toxin-antitoxin system HicB family antitoxin [Nodosilinea nodulosa]|uniref:type II toxin-antitoxin system HicB family antitoxin n=1 Tax=Nodosilinea nodulosa TaxID=416001 RepID=UPI0002FA28B6|nr:type II toxin-antitoxin system HicB family antitoxin [Nodosilinea nodulosa]